MKKTVLVLITFALVIAVAGSGFWLVHYFIDSREQRQTYENLAEEFVLESTPTPESTTPAVNSSPTENSSEPAESVSLTTARLATTWQPWQRKIRIAWGGLPSQTRGSTTPSCINPITRNITCAGISTVNPPAEGHPSWMVGTWQKQKIRTSFSTATT